MIKGEIRIKDILITDKEYADKPWIYITDENGDLVEGFSLDDNNLEDIYKLLKKFYSEKF